MSDTLRSAPPPHRKVRLRAPSRRAAPQHGFSLLEALITLLVVSLGLLGIAGVIATSLKANQGAYFRTVASLQAADIIDRIRANRTDAAGYALGGCPAGGGAGVPAADLADWCANLASSLPAGDGTVAIAGDLLTVTISWNDNRADIAGVDPVGGFSVETQL